MHSCGPGNRLAYSFVSDELLDLRTYLPAAEVRERGRALRQRTPLSARDRPAEGAHRPGVLEFIETSNRGRLPHLIPLRMGRMAASPFSFYRGAAGLMAADLAGGPDSGLTAQLCGDAHAANFGLYGSASGEIIMDINDFDETVDGPWEWDLERLAASLVLAGRVAGASEDDCRTAARDAARSYRRAVDELAEQPFMQSWCALPDESVLERAQAQGLIDDFEKAAKKARKNTSAKVVAKWVEERDEHGEGLRRHRFVSDPPLLTRVEESVREAVLGGLERYGASLRESRRTLLSRFALSDVALRIVGTGSVGLRTYVALLHGNRGESLVLQVKQAIPSSLAPFLPGTPPAHDGERIVQGARLVQVDTDILLGWTSFDPDGTGTELPFIVRQFRNQKGSIDPAGLTSQDLDDYGRLAGALLARAHTRSLDPRLLAGYLGDDEEFDAAVENFAVRYADRTEADHAELTAAIRSGVVAAEEPR